MLSTLLHNNTYTNEELNAIFLNFFFDVKLTQSGYEEIVEAVNSKFRITI
jgi:hypothetical protein